MSDILAEVTHGLQATETAFQAVAPVVAPVLPAPVAAAVQEAVTAVPVAVEMTQAMVNAATAAIPTVAVAEANSAPAPADHIEQWLGSLHKRIGQVEAIVQGVAPVMDVAAAVASGAYPPAAPLLARVSKLETVLEGVLSALDKAFPGKTETPAPGSVTG